MRCSSFIESEFIVEPDELGDEVAEGVEEDDDGEDAEPGEDVWATAYILKTNAVSATRRFIIKLLFKICNRTNSNCNGGAVVGPG